MSATPGTLTLHIVGVDGNGAETEETVTVGNTNGEWQRYEVTKSWNNLSEVDVVMSLENCAGSFLIDDVQLEKAPSANKTGNKIK